MIANLSKISSPYLRKRAGEIVAMVDEELGAPPQEPLTRQMRTALFLYVNNKRVVGCVICTTVKRAFRLSVPPPSPIANRQLVLRTPSPATSSSSAAAASQKNASPDTVATDLRRLKKDFSTDNSTKASQTDSESATVAASIGISRIWVGLVRVVIIFRFILEG